MSEPEDLNTEPKVIKIEVEYKDGSKLLMEGDDANKLWEIYCEALMTKPFNRMSLPVYKVIEK